MSAVPQGTDAEVQSHRGPRARAGPEKLPMWQSLQARPWEVGDHPSQHSADRGLGECPGVFYQRCQEPCWCGVPTPAAGRPV